MKIFKVSLFQTVALMDSFKLSAEQFVFRSRFISFQRLLLHALKWSDDLISDAEMRNLVSFISLGET